MGLTYRGDLNRPLTAAEIDGNFQHFTGSHAVTGSVSASLGFYGNLNGTANSASYAFASDTASFANFAADSAGQIVEVTYEELLYKIDEGELVPGKYYLIADFSTVYDRPDYFVNGNVKNRIDAVTEAQEPLMVFAISNSRIGENAYQPHFPNDKIKYDWTFGKTEINSFPAFGRISERIDEYGNRTDYDHRTIQFKRYRSYIPSNKLTGQIISYDCNSGVIVGDGNTQFDVELMRGEVIMLDMRNGYVGDYENGWEYNIAVKVIGISSANQIIVATDPDFTSINFSGFEIDVYHTNAADYNHYKEYYVGQANDEDFKLYRTFHRLDEGQIVGNHIGEYSKYYQQGVSSNSGFLLANNVFLNQAYSNTVGERGYNNTVQQWFINNVVGNKFTNNIIQRGFYRNEVGFDFGNNIFEHSINNNVIGNYFQYNYSTGPQGYIYNNKIANDFYNNNITYTISYNKIGDGFTDNNLNGYFQNNIVADYFYQNYIYNTTQNNLFRENTKYNTLGLSGSANAYKFEYNNFNAAFGGNFIPKAFARNTVHGKFLGNSVNSDDMIVGEFVDNVITQEASFNQFEGVVSFNQFNAPFYNNNSTQGMTQNTFDCEVTGSSFSSSNFINAPWTCRIYKDRTDGVKLSYMDEGSLSIFGINE